MKPNAYHEGLRILGDGTEFEDNDLYSVAFAGEAVSRDDRRKLKELGWKSKRHTRTKEEIWIFDFPAGLTAS
jgi:hypothetical protein